MLNLRLAGCILLLIAACDGTPQPARDRPQEAGGSSGARIGFSDADIDMVRRSVFGPDAEHTPGRSDTSVAAQNLSILRSRMDDFGVHRAPPSVPPDMLQNFEILRERIDSFGPL